MILNRKDRLRYFRKALGLNQDEMGEKLGMTRATYSVVENGGGISEQYLLALYELGVSLDWLFAGVGEMNHRPKTLYALEEEPIFSFGGNHITNKGAIGGDMVTNIQECRHELELARLELSELKKRLTDKEEIIELLKRRNK